MARCLGLTLVAMLVVHPGVLVGQLTPSDARFVGLDTTWPVESPVTAVTSAAQASGRAWAPLTVGASVVLSPREQEDGFYPQMSTTRELVASAVGVGLLTWGGLQLPEPPPVARGGLDPAEIDWSLDRRVVGHRDFRAYTLSDWALGASMALPFVVMLSTADGDDRWAEIGARSAIYAQAFANTLGVIAVGKSHWERPRPFVYLPRDHLPADARYDVERSRAFQAMPSGHSSSAWTGAAMALTEHLLLRPRAAGWERLGVGLLGGALAGATGGLRIKAGQHFPSDVLVGAGVGILGGIVFPLLHRGQTPLPSAGSWTETFGSALVGGGLAAVWAGS